MDEDGERDGGVVDALAGRAVGLLRPRPAHHDRVDGLEVARVGDERDRDLARLGLVHALGAEVVLDVARAAFRGADDRVDRPLALELAQDLLVRLADRVREDAQPPTVRHPDHDLVGASFGSELDRLVQHRASSRRGPSAENSFCPRNARRR